MEYFLKVAAGLGIIAATFAFVAWMGWRSLKRSDDPAALVTKWIFTAIGFGMLLAIAPLGIFAAIGAAIIGVILGIMWAPNLGAVVARPFTSLYDDGDIEPDARPFYSIAHARRKQGKYNDAIAHIQEQLKKFPEDYEGWMLLADIHAENLKDNAAAQTCIQEILHHPHHAPKNIAYALNRSADWHLRLAADRNGAETALRQITQLLPETEHAQQAHQRIARLTSDQMLAEQKNRPTIRLVHHEEKLGLLGKSLEIKSNEVDPATQAASLVQHLNEHPFDIEAREQLATIYAHHYAKLDLAADQLEQLIASPGAAQKQIAHWLNLLADFHIKIASDTTAASAALQRVVDLFPNSAVAANAEKRLAYLGLELKHAPSAPIPLPSKLNSQAISQKYPGEN